VLWIGGGSLILLGINEGSAGRRTRLYKGCLLALLACLPLLDVPRGLGTVNGG
jgi:hypothetical protein